MPEAMMNRSNDGRAGSAGRRADHKLTFEASPKRVRVMAGGKTIGDTLSAGLLFETGYRPVYYLPRSDVRMDLLTPSQHRTHCPYKGDASYWHLDLGHHRVENAVWSYEDPLPEMAQIKHYMAFYQDKVDHWFEEDEEVFGHPRDPHHRIDVRPSSRRVRVIFAGETVAETIHGLFLFETGLPTRYYIPPADVRMDLLEKTRTQTICPYKGTASYWSIRVGDKYAKDAVWGYLEPLADCPRIAGHLCFYPEKIDRLEVEGEPAKG
jgi:uncharacterized protein (DUF427 family)